MSKSVYTEFFYLGGDINCLTIGSQNIAGLVSNAFCVL